MCRIGERENPSYLLIILILRLKIRNRRTRFWRSFDRVYAIEEGFPSGASSKESDCSAVTLETLNSIPGWGRSSEGGHGKPVQYSCLENPMDNAPWWATVHSAARSQTRLSDLAPMLIKATKRAENRAKEMKYL